MRFKKVDKDIYIDDFHRTFTTIDTTKVKVKESISAIYELIQTPIYNNEEGCFYLQMPFGVELLSDEHAVIPLGIESDTPYYIVKSDSKDFTVESVTQTGDLFVHIHNTSDKLIQFEPDQVFAKAFEVVE